MHRDIPLTAASRLDLRAGRASRARGALIGAGAGALTGLMLGIMISDAFNGTVAEGAAISPYFMPYTIAGGVVFGALVPGDRWTRVRLTPRP